MKKELTGQEYYEIKYTLPELIKLKSFFENVLKEDNKNAIVGEFGSSGIFYGNIIDHNCQFNIPASAMKLIYKANKKSIDSQIKYLKDLENTYE